MKRLLSMSLAIIMAVTVFGVPAVSAVYGDTVDKIDSFSDSSAEASDEDLNSEAIDLSDVSAKLSATEFIYTGNEIKPKPVVMYGDIALDAGTDFSVSYINNVDVGTATVIIKGIGNYKGSKALSYGITPADISKATVTLKNTYYDYTGNSRTPEIALEFNGISLTEDVDYKLKYSSDIIYPGTKTVTILGENNFKSSLEKKYYIGYVNNFKVKSTGTSSISFGWSREPRVTGYQISKYNISSKKWETIKTIEGNQIITYKRVNLKSGLGAKYRIRSFVDDSQGSRHYGTWSKTLAAATRPGKVTLKKLTTSVRLNIKATWSKTTSTGYQVMVSRKSDFSSSTKYTVKSSGILSKTIKAGKNNQTYYIKVRAYKTYGGKTLYGAWSNIKKIKTDGTGWGTFSGKKYYYRNGKPLKGQHTINGNKYFFSDYTGVLLGTTSTMWNKVKNQGSGSKYLIAVSKGAKRTCVYYRKEGKWILKYYWKCTVGAPGTRTPSGEFSVPKVKSHLKYFGNSKGYTCWYATRIFKVYYFHSVLYYPASQVNILDGRLGGNLSHGCVRLAKSNALWLYKNIDAGTKIVIY